MNINSGNVYWKVSRIAFGFYRFLGSISKLVIVNSTSKFYRLFSKTYMIEIIIKSIIFKSLQKRNIFILSIQKRKFIKLF